MSSNDGWNIVPLACVPSEPPEHSTTSTAAARFRAAPFGRQLIAWDEIGGLITNPLKEQS